MQNDNKNNKHFIKIILAIILALFILIIVIFYFSKSFISDFFINKELNKELAKVNDSINNAEFISNLLNDSLENLHNFPKDKFITVLITGLDSRINTSYNHADANHLIKIYPDSGFIDIISIPRGTYVNLGIVDTINQNYLANLRALKGREKYWKEVCKIAGVEKIDYFVEFGFSQAMGILNMLGFKDNSRDMLRILRSRKAFNLGDYQRCYNQGNFIRQTIFKLLDINDNLLIDVMIKGFLGIVETNLTYESIKEMQIKLKKHNIGKDIAMINLSLKPKLANNLLSFDFYDKEDLVDLQKKINNLKIQGENKKYDNYEEVVFNKLKLTIKSIMKDTLKNNLQAHNRLKLLYNQRAWLQITTPKDREEIRNAITTLLIKSYLNTGNKNEARKIIESLQNEQKALNN